MTPYSPLDVRSHTIEESVMCRGILSCIAMVAYFFEKIHGESFSSQQEKYWEDCWMLWIREKYWCWDSLVEEEVKLVVIFGLWGNLSCALIVSQSLHLLSGRWECEESINVSPLSQSFWEKWMRLGNVTHQLISN